MTIMTGRGVRGQQRGPGFRAGEAGGTRHNSVEDHVVGAQQHDVGPARAQPAGEGTVDAQDAGAKGFGDGPYAVHPG
ncbi:hypothetical protein AB0O76_42760 [Streptomyces sp. NPDC086554]|uniref:hypothetical protein n=1 Tax=Streptomyces sp. NPDC086554 TaxID=3154864 RepID=UPI00342795C2